ncbi:MAG: Tryptophan-tRNA ligase [Candidatus Magasanikbacteria bacterium GW2011_GWA2_46_17]|uniref:Tryptophan--tRNA ligase n=2 Tax=Parcubacteria group TaxID=1794811 RepID=A0A0G1P2S0_9BACT|nr:MAG: Tryptophan-tRNA ligase [Candidatus Magasanikbacteria bacterium GW2011_GWA2_46_17]OGG60980.1 MAG: tryptophan--tRNA ligase [Candidatus Kaiserbacteria bacterium RIFCSPHIGHO2_02_FULL_49_16]
MQKKRLLTGVQPSGALHIGNYLGALKPFVSIYGEYESMLMVADYHSLTTLKDSGQVRENIMSAVRDYVAIGVDPKRVIIFQQSAIQAHTELAWILECQVTVPFLMQAHAYKDKVAKGLEANAGLFCYPMLMAADILIYDTDVVPIGQDQKQHVEYAREAAAKFNKVYGDTFKDPEEMILRDVATVPGTDGQKMSKSYGNTIPLFGTKNEILKAVMSIITDSKGESPENVYAIHRLIKDETEIAALYKSNKGKYKVVKDALAEDIESLVAPMREKRDSITDSDVVRILKDGAERAREQAEAKMKVVRERVGVAL